MINILQKRETKIDIPDRNAWKVLFFCGIISRYTVLEVQFDICEEIEKKLLVRCFFIKISKFRKVWQMTHMGTSKSSLPSQITLK